MIAKTRSGNRLSHINAIIIDIANAIRNIIAGMHTTISFSIFFKWSVIAMELNQKSEKKNYQ